METKKQLSLTFSIVGIDTVAFELKKLTDTMHLKNIQVQMSLGFEVTAENKWIVVHLPVSYTSEDGSVILCHADNSFIYKIENFNEIVQLKPDGSFQIDELAMRQLSTISISTMRGIMYEKFRGTHLHGVLMNPIDPTTLNLTIQREVKAMAEGDKKRTKKKE